MPKIRGKNLTVFQRKNVMATGVISEDELKNYLIQKVKHVDPENKNLSKFKEKLEVYVLSHRDTGDTKEVTVRCVE
jgi:hypothetical protein